MSCDSCTQCPAYRDREALRTTLNNPKIDFDSCGRFGYVLSRPTLSAEASLLIKRKVAVACDQAGQEYSGQTYLPAQPVGTPSPEAIAQLPDGKEDIPSCLSCQFYIMPVVVKETHGWRQGMCGAKGSLVVDPATQAKHCDVSKMATPGRTSAMLASSVKLFGQFSEPSAIQVIRSRMGGEIIPWEDFDPEKHSAKPVDARHRDQGVRGWRQIKHASSERTILVPVVDHEYLSKQEIEHVPATGAEGDFPELYVDHENILYAASVSAFKKDRTLALWGQPGTGKTEFFKWFAWLMGTPFTRISIDERSDVEDTITGKWGVEDGATVFYKARLSATWDRPGLSCIDEPNTGPPAVWQAVRPLTDNSKQLILDAAKGELIKKHILRVLGMAMNPAWDPKNIGAMELSDADGNRLLNKFVRLPPEQVERDIIRNYCKTVDGFDLDKKIEDTIMAIAREIRVYCDEDQLPISWGIRPQIAVASLTESFSLEECYRLAVTDRLAQHTGGPADVILGAVIAKTPAGM